MIKIAIPTIAMFLVLVIILAKRDSNKRNKNNYLDDLRLLRQEINANEQAFNTKLIDRKQYVNNRLFVLERIVELEKDIT